MNTTKTNTTVRRNVPIEQTRNIGIAVVRELETKAGTAVVTAEVPLAEMFILPLNEFRYTL